MKNFEAINVFGFKDVESAQELHEHFSKYGTIDGMKIYLNEDKVIDSITLIFLPNTDVDKLLTEEVIFNDIRVYAEKVSSLIDIKIQEKYRDFEIYKLESLNLGQLTDFKSYLNYFELKSSYLDFDFDKFRTIIYFEHLTIQYKLMFNFIDIYQHILIKKEGDEYTLVFRLNSAPKLWKINNQRTFGNPKLFDTNEDWIRITDLGKTEHVDLSNFPVEVFDSRLIDYGKWNAIRIRVKFTKNDWEAITFKRLILSLKNHNLAADPIVYTKLEDSKPEDLYNNRRRYLDLDFGILFLLESLISHNLISEQSICDKFLYLIISQPLKDTYRILEDIWGMKKKVWKPLDHYQKCIDKNNTKLTPELSIATYCAMIKKVVITPSTIYFVPAVLETSNRVLRHYKKFHHQFLRVVFSDEELQKVNSNQIQNDIIFKRILRVLNHGIKIADKLFEFLAFSASQLREHGCWFFSDSPEITKEEIRAWMGDFTKIKTAAKYSARMGQCFSSTRDVARLTVEDIQHIPDIVRNGYVFSDGVGKISHLLLVDITNIFDLPYYPTAIQFRLGGFKGVLACSKDIPDYQIQLRPSQNKFESNHTILEIVRVSSYTSCHLNRQIITILSSLGVPDKVFQDLQNEMIDELSCLLTDERIALKILGKNADEYGLTASLSKLIKAGFMKQKDPYLMNILQLLNVILLTELKNKSRIHVIKGVFLMGVIDEFLSLEENQIFVQHSSIENPFFRNIVLGPCLIVRNPCFHPGDIRLVQAIDVPSLHNFTDVVVFPALGERDLANQCSGGDLDGDDYTIIWDPRLFPPVSMPDPMDYQSIKPVQVDQVQISEVKKFFVDYMINDNLGVIANAHLALSDSSKLGAFDRNCIKLAHLHSDAVDFPKSGIAACLPQNLRVKKYPDFMEKPDKISYKSKKIIGVLYRQVSLCTYNPLNDRSIDVRLKVEGYEKYIDDAKVKKIAYDLSIKQLMNQYGINNEMELISGYILSHREIVKKKSYDVRRLVMRAYQTIKKKFRIQFEKEFYEEDSIISLDKLKSAYQKASAWYFISYHPEMTDSDSDFTKCKFFSFPWIVSDLLSQIAAYKSSIQFDDVAIDSLAYKTISASLKENNWAIDSDYKAQHVEQKSKSDLDLLNSVFA